LPNRGSGRIEVVALATAVVSKPAKNAASEIFKLSRYTVV
jgi:hypothetical protein